MDVSADKFTRSKITEARLLHVSTNVLTEVSTIPAFKVVFTFHIIVMTYNNMTSFWL